MHSPSGCLVKYIIAKYTKMSNSKNRPLAATRNRPTSPKRRAYEQIYCIIFGDSLQETGCLFCT
nr:MAG TPA: hypothetical protein [Caudoviricetes sp.]